MSKVTVYTGGPAVIEDTPCWDGQDSGPRIHLYREDGSYELHSVLAICICGKSKSKPFCDGSHKPKPLI